MHKAKLLHVPANAGVELRQLDRFVIQRPVSWDNKSQVLSLFRSMVSGKANGIRLFDVNEVLEKEMNKIDPSILAQKLLVKVQIGTDDHNSMWYFNAWAIIPADTPLEHLMVARESLNSTLVLAIYKWEMPAAAREGTMAPENAIRKTGREPAHSAQILAYLNTTHQDNGTYLIKVDEKGVVDIVFRTADTPQRELFWLPESMEVGIAD